MCYITYIYSRVRVYIILSKSNCFVFTIILLTIYLLIAYLRQVSNDITIYFVPFDVKY